MLTAVDVIIMRLRIFCKVNIDLTVLSEIDSQNCFVNQCVKLRKYQFDTFR